LIFAKIVKISLDLSKKVASSLNPATQTRCNTNGQVAKFCRFKSLNARDKGAKLANFISLKIDKIRHKISITPSPLHLKSAAIQSG